MYDLSAWPPNIHCGIVLKFGMTVRALLLAAARKSSMPWSACRKSQYVKVFTDLLLHVTSTASREPAQGAAPNVESLLVSVQAALPTQAATTTAETSFEQFAEAASALQKPAGWP